MPSSADILPSSQAEELIDFTCASPWERLALDIELELRAWGLHDGQLPSHDLSTSNPVARPDIGVPPSSLGPRPLVRSQVAFADVLLALELRVFPEPDALDAYPLQRLFGLSQCVVLTAAAQDGIAANDASDAAVLLSAMSVAASACACPLPMIVPVGRPSSLRFIGRQLYPAHRRFSCDYTHQPPDDCGHLAGLLNLFRNKRASAKPHIAHKGRDARISARFIYDWNDFSFKLALSPGTFASDRRLSAVQSAALSEADPVNRIQVTAIWDEFPVIDLQRNETLAGMPASTANRLLLSPSREWLKSIGSVIPSSRIPMTAAARANLRLAEAAASLPERKHPAAPLAVINVEKAARNSKRGPALEQSPRATHLHASDRTNSPRIARSPTATALDEYLAQVGEYVAAAAIQDDRIDEDFLTSAVAALFEMDVGRGIMADVVEALGPNASDMMVLEKVSRLMAVSESTNAAQKLWNLFVDGLEVHWEQQWLICGVPFNSDSGPSHDENLMVQKLQMINCCTERIRREQKGMMVQTGGQVEPNGRKSLLGGVRLIGSFESSQGDGSSSDVWEPYVQPHRLVTRDMVEEELKRMVLRAEAAEKDEDLEAKLQSKTLQSDMMAFKAANPGAGMADFVRWFSPSDWIVDQVDGDAVVTGQKSETIETGAEVSEARSQNEASFAKEGNKQRAQQGRLSVRMSRKGNIWEKLWKEAEAIPAHGQVPLFDACAHGSKALADLRAMSLTQVLLHLSVIQGESTTGLLKQAFNRPPEVGSVRLTIERARHAMRDVCGGLGISSDEDCDELGRVATALEMVAVAEQSCLTATSVLTKLPPADGMGPIIDQLACGQCAVVEQERERRLVTRMAGLDDDGWRNVLLPEWREFVVHGSDEDRMYARVSREEFRVGFQLGLDYSG